MVIQAIVGGTYLPAELTTKMLTARQGTYALGIGSYPFSCGTLYGHQGGWNGTASIATASTTAETASSSPSTCARSGDPDLVSLAEDLLLSGAGMTSLNDASRSTARSRCCSSGGGAGGRQSGRSLRLLTPAATPMADASVREASRRAIPVAAQPQLDGVDRCPCTWMSTTSPA